MPDEVHLVELREVFSVENLGPVKTEITEMLRGIAAEAEAVANRVGTGGPASAGPTAATAYATEAVTGIRSQLEQRIASQRTAGAISTQEAATLRGFLTRTFSDMSKLPAELQRFMQGSQYASQQQIRAAIGGIGHTPGPTSAQAPSTSGVPTGRSPAQEATENARLKALALQELAVGGEWVQQRAEEVRAGYQLHAGVVEELASTTEYAGYKARAASAQAQINAQQQRLLGIDGEYARAQAVATRSKSVQAAAQEQLLAQDSLYTRAQATVVRAKAQQAANVAGALEFDTQYARNQAAVTRSKTVQQAMIEAELSASTPYLRAQQIITRSKAEQQASIQGSLATDERYIGAQQGIARAKAEQQAKIQSGLAVDDRYLRATAESAVARAASGAQVQELLAKDGLYAEAQARAATAKAEQTARTQEVLASDDRYAQANARATAARDQIAAQTARLQLAPENLNANIGRRMAEENLRAQQQGGYNRALLEEPGQATINRSAQAQSLREAVERQRNIILEQNRSEDGVLAETVQLRTLKERRVALERALAAGVAPEAGETTATLRGRTAAAEQATAAEQRAATARELLANERGELDQIVEQKALERRLNQEIESRVRQANIAQNGGQIGQGGSAFQRLQAYIQARQSGDVVDPTRLMGLGQFATSRALTTVGFAASGAALYGTLRTVKEMVQEAEQLDLVMGQVRAEFQALGRGDQFEGFRSQILGIARDTGVAAQEVAGIGQLMEGAFQDPAVAVQQTREAVEAMRVTGLSGAEALNTFVAVTKTFGVTVQEVSDTALSLQDNFGVAAKEIITGAAAIAPIAQQVGLSWTQLSALVASAAQSSGRSAQSVAEGFGRILPEMQKQAGPIIELFAQVPALQGDLAKVTQDFAQGNEGQALVLLAHHWTELSSAQQSAFLDMLGGRKNAQDLAAALNDPDRLVQALDGHMVQQGRTAQSYAAYQASLAGTLARVREQLRQIGDDLARSGALDALKILAGGAEGVVTVLSLMLRVAGDVNQALDGWPGRIIAIVAAFKALELAIQAIQKAREVGAAINVAIGGGGGVGGVAAAAAGGGGVPGSVLSPEAQAVLAGGAGGAARGAFGAALIRRIGAVGQRSFGGALPGGGLGALGVGTEGGIAGSGWLAGGSLSLGFATAGLGAADYYAISLAMRERGRVQKDRADAAKINADQFRGENLRQLLGNQDLYAPKKGDESESTGDLIGGKLGFGDFLRGRTAAQNQQRDAIQAETVREFDAAVRAGDFNAFPPDEIKKLQQQVDSSGGKKGGQRAQELLLQLSRGQYAQVQTAAQRAKQIGQTQSDAAAGNTTLQLQTIQTIQERLGAGEISVPEAISAMNAQVANLRAADNGTSPEIATQLRQAITAVQQAESQSIDQQVSLAQTIAQATGQDPASAQLGVLQQNVVGYNPQNPRMAGERVAPNPNLSVDQRLQYGETAYSAGYQAFQYEIAHAHSAAQALDIAKAGAAVDPAVRDQLEKAYEEKWHEKLNLPDYQASQDQVEQLSQQALQEQISGIQVQYAGARDPAAQAAQAAAIADAQRKSAEALPDDDPNKQTAINNAKTAQAQAANQAQDVDEANRHAKDELRQARDNRDPVKVAQDQLAAATADYNEAVAQQRGQAAIDAAHAKVIQAQQNADDANAGIQSAQIEYTKSLAPDDRIAQAKAAQQEADLAAKNAHGRAAELAAMAQRRAADRTMEDAMFEISQSQVKLLQTQAQVAGNMIEAAQYGVQLAQNELTKAIKDKADPGRIAELQGALEQQKGNLRDVTLQTNEDAIQFNLDMRRITIGQAIEQLNALLSIANPQQQMDILRRIQALRQQAGQDMQFNIPSDIKLPTLYEVRRTEQLGATGYQDNRQVSVVMHINNGMDQQSATKWLTDTVGRSARVTSGSRRV